MIVQDFLSDETDPVNSAFLTIALTNPAKAFTRNELYEILGEGAIRYICGIGPGITDKDKGKKNTAKSVEEQFKLEINRFGDLIIWKEILNFAKGKSINLVFVEDEKKNDWWTKENTVPQELVDEFMGASPASQLFMVDLKEFLSQYQEELLLPAGECQKLVKRLCFRENVSKYLLNEGAIILEEHVRNELDDSNTFYELIKEMPIRLGFIEEVVEYEIDTVNVERHSLELDNMSGELFLDGTVQIECKANVSCYISHEFSISQEYILRMQFVASSLVNIQYDDLDVEPANAFELMGCSFIGETLLSETMANEEYHDSDK